MFIDLLRIYRLHLSHFKDWWLLPTDFEHNPHGNELVQEYNEDKNRKNLSFWGRVVFLYQLN